jgi:hypothetical protein
LFTPHFQGVVVAKKAKSASDRSDPKKNKSLAIRMVLERNPAAKAGEVAAEVKKEFGHEVKQNMVYMVKTKLNMKAQRKGGKRRKTTSANGQATLSSAAQWVEAIKIARNLLRVTGSVADATALLKAVEG